MLGATYQESWLGQCSQPTWTFAGHVLAGQLARLTRRGIGSKATQYITIPKARRPPSSLGELDLSLRYEVAQNRTKLIGHQPCIALILAEHGATCATSNKSIGKSDFPFSMERGLRLQFDQCFVRRKIGKPFWEFKSCLVGHLRS